MILVTEFPFDYTNDTREPVTLVAKGNGGEIYTLALVMPGGQVRCLVSPMGWDVDSAYGRADRVALGRRIADMPWTGDCDGDQPGRQYRGSPEHFADIANGRDDDNDSDGAWR